MAHAFQKGEVGGGLFFLQGSSLGTQTEGPLRWIGQLSEMKRKEKPASENLDLTFFTQPSATVERECKAWCNGLIELKVHHLVSKNISNGDTMCTLTFLCTLETCQVGVSQP